MLLDLNSASGVETTLLKTSLAVVRSAVGVDVSPAYSILLPPTVHQTRYGSALLGR